MKHFNHIRANLKKFWENPVLWNQYNTEGKDYQDRLLAIKEMLPKNIKTVVEAGCGKGDVLITIEADTKIAVDISETVLNYIEDKNITKIKGSITELDKLLPDNVNQVDLLICLEVLEHLLDDEFEKAVKSILRLGAKFLLIGVPFKEPLARRSFYCNNCGKLFNVDTHFRSFSKEGCCNLFSGEYTLFKKAYVGDTYLRLWPSFYKLKNRCIEELDKFAICYYCGNDNFSTNNPLHKKISRYFMNKLEYIFKYFLFWKRYPYWMLLLFEYKEERI